MFNSYFFSKSVCGCWPWSSKISADHCWMGFNNNWRIHCKCFATGKSVITVHLLVTDHDWIHEGLYTLYWGSLEFKNIWCVVQFYLQFKIMWSLEWLNMMLVFYISSDICGFSPFSGPQLSWITNSNTTNINGWMLPNVRGIMLQKRWKSLIFFDKSKRCKKWSPLSFFIRLKSPVLPTTSARLTMLPSRSWPSPRIRSAPEPEPSIHALETPAARCSLIRLVLGYNSRDKMSPLHFCNSKL